MRGIHSGRRVSIRGAFCDLFGILRTIERELGLIVECIDIRGALIVHQKPYCRIAVIFRQNDCTTVRISAGRDAVYVAGVVINGIDFCCCSVAANSNTGSLPLYRLENGERSVGGESEVCCWREVRDVFTTMNVDGEC